MKKHTNDLKKRIERLDPKNVGISIAALAEQINESAKKFPKKTGLPRRTWKNIFVCAMGGSGLGADVLRSLYASSIRVPLTMVHGYVLPSFVDAGSLIVVISYSGTTEESLACMRQAYKKGCGLFVICSGGTMARELVKKKIPHYIFPTTFNPSNQPRIGTGYTMTAVYMLLKKEKLLTSGNDDLLVAAQHIPEMQYQALQWAKEFKGKSFLIIGAEHLKGNAHIMSNQLNESAKAFAPYFVLPELNHHLLEGLGSLQSSKRHWIVIILDSADYDPRIQKRTQVTEKVLVKQGFTIRQLKVRGTRATQCLALLSFGSWLSYYSAIVSGIDPSTIPWVDYFKKQLA